MISHAERVSLRFVLSKDAPDADSNRSDVLSFQVPENGRVLGTYLLANAFFRYALAQRPHIPYIARADDDSFFDLQTVLLEMQAAACTVSRPEDNRVRVPRRWRRVNRTSTLTGRRLRARASSVPRQPACDPSAATIPIIYGHFQEWYMWSAESMMVRSLPTSRRRRARHAYGRRSDIVPPVSYEPRPRHLTRSRCTLCVCVCLSCDAGNVFRLLLRAAHCHASSAEAAWVELLEAATLRARVHPPRPVRSIPVCQGPSGRLLASSGEHSCFSERV